MALRWFVLRVQSGREDRICENLQKRVCAAGLEASIPRILVPTETVSEIKNGKKRNYRRKIYPGYLLVQMDLTDDVWFLIRETGGIGDFVGAHGRPAPMEPFEVEKLLADMERTQEKPKVKIEFQKGESVKIKEGPFESFEGIVDEVFPDKGLVKVVVTIFGRPTPVELEYWQVEAI
ncbi:MAG: transcription termination/antitermination protein NusG [Planctomycetes bacterium]|nr:transcription termination/antitermination protein NusG [Planctomycetota bacterium]